jgi:pilus assembly protein CpaB
MTRSRLWFIATVLLAILTGLLVYRYLSGSQEAAVAEVMTTQVMAKVRIPAGARIAADMLETSQIPVKYAQSSGIRDAKTVVGQYALADILPGEVVAAGRVATEKTTGELPYKIPEGTRAITVPVNALSGVAGLLKPGHYVDVLVSYKTSDTLVDLKVVTLLQNVLVLAVGPEMQKKEGVQAVENVTLAVAPADAEIVTLGESIGRLKLVARPPGESETYALPYADVARMLTMYP